MVAGQAHASRGAEPPRRSGLGLETLGGLSSTEALGTVDCRKIPLTEARRLGSDGRRREEKEPAKRCGGEELVLRIVEDFSRGGFLPAGIP